MDSDHRELLIVCAWTKRIKVGDRWLSLEQYLLEVHCITVSHGICPEAALQTSDLALGPCRCCLSSISKLCCPRD